jgi:hypothetical protein
VIDVTALLAAIDNIANLPENWDTYGGLAVPSKVIERAKCIVQLIHSAPVIAPMVTGGVYMVWESADAAVTIIIRTDGCDGIYVDVWPPDAPTTKEGDK